MNCLSSEDLKEERNFLLTVKSTLNPHPCPVWVDRDPLLVGETSSLQCAGINRHEAGNERVLRVGSSDPLGLESCGGHREVHAEA